MPNEIVPFAQIKEMAEALGKGKLFGKSADELLPLMMVAAAEGTNPVQAALEWDIISGKPALKTTALMARFQKSGGKITYIERSDSACEASFEHPLGASVSVRWNLERAKKAGLLGKGPWQQYPAQMLSARCIAEGVRACYPAILSNLYTVDELITIDMPIDATDYEALCREEFPDLDERMGRLTVKPTFKQIWERKDGFRKSTSSEGA